MPPPASSASDRDSPVSSPSPAAQSARGVQPAGPSPLVAAAPDSAPTATATETAYSALNFRKDFFFRRRHGALDWSRVLRVDLESVVRTVDVDALQSNVEHMTFSDITEADLSMLTDANFLQLWRLMQLIVEYLLNVQNYLLASAQKREALHTALEKQLAQERARADQAEEDCRALKREVKYSRRVVRAYEKSMASKWSSLTPAVSDAAQAPQKCGVCSSAFVNYEFLKGHYGRRHPDEPLPPPPPAAVAAAPAAAAEEKAAPAPTAAEFAAWKREMESSLRRELAEEARKAAAATALVATQSTRTAAKPNSKSLEDEESILAKRLGAMESTLAAVLNNNVVPLGAQPEVSFPNSRARGLRDDDAPAASVVDEGSAKVEAEASLKEYFRRQMFDLLEEIKDLKQQQAQTAAHAAAQAAAAAHAAHYQQQLQPAHLMSPHPPAAAHVFTTPHGLGGTVPRHVPALHPLPPAASAPVPVAVAASPVALPASPRKLLSLRELLEAHRDKRFEPFPRDLPGLMSRTPLSETDLVSTLNSFAVISQSVVARGAAGMAAVEEEVEAMGYAQYSAEVAEELEEYMRAHYTRSAGYAEAQKTLVQREERNHSLHEAWATVRQREAEQHAAYVAQREAMEAQVLQAQLQREQEAQRLAAQQAAQQAQALADERRMAAQLSAAHASHRANIASGNIRPSPIALTPLASPGSGGVLPTPSGSSGGLPAYPTPSPASSPLPFNAAAAAQWEAQRQQSQSQMTLQLPSPASRQAALSGGVAPSPTASQQTQQQQQAQRQASMRRPSTLAATAEDSDEDEDYNPAASAATVGAGSITQQQQPQQQQQQQPQPLQPRPQLQQQQSSTGAVISKPPTPPVPIPARPNKSAIAAASSAASTSYTAGALPPRVPVDRQHSFSAGGGQQYIGGGIITTASSGVQASQQPQQQQQQPQQQLQQEPAAASRADEVQAFSVGGSNTSSPGLRPSAGAAGSGPLILPDLLATPVVGMDPVSRVRQPTRRLSAMGGGGPAEETPVDEFVPSARRDSGSTVSNAGSDRGDAVQPFEASASSSSSQQSLQQQQQQGLPAMRPAAARSILKHYPPGTRPPIAINQSLLQGGGGGGGGISPTDRDRQERLERDREAADMALDEPSREYEHSTARQDRDPGPEHEFGGLDEPYEDRDAQHLFSPPLAGSSSPLRKPSNQQSGTSGVSAGAGGRRMSETEDLDASSSRLALAPGSRTRSVGGGSGVVAPSSSSASGSSTAAAVPASRFSGPTVGHSANFSVASSQDWQSGNEIMDDDLEELIA